MSEESESFDLSARDLMANWVSDLEKPPSQRREEKPADDRPPKSRSKGKSNRGGYGRFDDDRSRGGGRPPGRGGGGRDRDDRNRPRHGKGRDFKEKGRGGYRGGDRDRDRGQRERPEDSLKNVEAIVEPAPEAVKALAGHIRSTGRAYALADVAKMVLQARDRYQLVFRAKQHKGARGGKAEAPVKVEANPGPKEFFHCESDGSLWLSRDEAVAHVLRSPVLKQFYTVEEIEVDPPKGNFSVIAVCGMSGKILGPPNHHEYQTNLARLHRERFSGMSFERYKSRIEMHRDEETLEKWKEQVSRRRIYRVGPTIEEAPDQSEEETTGLENEDQSSVESPADETGSTPDAEGDASKDSAAETTDEVSGDGSGEESSEAPTGEELVPESEEAKEEEAKSDGEKEGAGEPAEEESEGETETLDAEAESEETGEPAPEPAEEAAEPEAEILNSEEELGRHFREHYADEAVKAVTKAVVSGNIPGRDLSGPLLSKLKSEVEKLKRGFPLPMIQELCRHFEKEGLRFFKRGKKTLYVSVIRPRPIKNEEAFTDRIRSIVAFVREHPRAKVIQLLNALVPDYQPPPGGESFEEHQLTEAERGILADLRWLTMEGYVIEFPNSELLLGGHEPSRSPETNPQAASKPKPSRSKAKSVRPRRPKKKGRNLPVPNPLKAKAEAPKPAPAEAAEPESGAESATSTEPVEAPAEETSTPESVDGTPKTETESSETAQETGSPIAEELAEPGTASQPDPDSSSESEPAEVVPQKTSVPSEEETLAENESGSDVPDDEAPPQDTSVTS